MATYYVDINDSYTTTGTGSSSSKFTYTQFINTLTTSYTNDTFYLVGTLTGCPDLYADFRQDSLSGLSVHKKVVSMNKAQPASMKIKYLVGGHYDNSWYPYPDYPEYNTTNYSHIVEFKDIIMDTSGIDVEIPVGTFSNSPHRTYEEEIRLHYPHVEYTQTGFNYEYVGACGGFIFNNCHIKISGGLDGDRVGSHGKCGIVYHPGSMIQFINSNVILNDDITLIGEADYGGNYNLGGWSLLTISRSIFSSTSNVAPLIAPHIDKSRLYVKCYGNVYDAVTSAYSTYSSLSGLLGYSQYATSSLGYWLTDEYGQVLGARPSLFSSAISAVNSSAVNYVTSEFSAINVAGYGYSTVMLGSTDDRIVYADGGYMNAYRDGPGFLHFPQITDTSLSATLDVTSATVVVDDYYQSIVGNVDLFSGSQAKIRLNVNSDIYSKYGVKYLVFFDSKDGGVSSNPNAFFNRVQTSSATSAEFSYDGSLLLNQNTIQIMDIYARAYPKNSYITPTSANNFLSDIKIANGGNVQFGFRRPCDPYSFSIRTLSGTEYTSSFKTDDEVTLKIFDYGTSSNVYRTSIIWGDGTSTSLNGISDEYTHVYATSGLYTIQCYITDVNNYTYDTEPADITVSNTSNSILYVDLAGTTSGIGTIANPIGGEQFIDVVYSGMISTSAISPRQIFKLRGSIYIAREYPLNSSVPFKVKSGSRYMFDVWNASLYGPWVMQFYDRRASNGRVVGDFTGTTLRGGIIFNYVPETDLNGVRYIFTKLYNMYVVCQGYLSKVEMVTDSRNTVFDESYIIGSTIYSPNGISVS